MSIYETIGYGYARREYHRRMYQAAQRAIAKAFRTADGSLTVGQVRLSVSHDTYREPTDEELLAFAKTHLI